jgi:polyisoprenoid-binding protein YceI
LYELGPSNGSITLRTGRTGAAARAGHDLVIEVEQWRAELELSTGGDQGSRVTATIDATSLRVREGVGGLKPLTDKDRAEIERLIADKLQSGRFPEITFESTAIHGAEESLWRVEGRLTIAGATLPMLIPVSAARVEEGTSLSASASIVQSAFGIKPYTGMLGALKVADAVAVQFEATLPPDG